MLPKFIYIYITFNIVTSINGTTHHSKSTTNGYYTCLIVHQQFRYFFNQILHNVIWTNLTRSSSYKHSYFSVNDLSESSKHTVLFTRDKSCDPQPPGVKIPLLSHAVFSVGIHRTFPLQEHLSKVVGILYSVQ